jgi:DNA-binding transcriptional MerR regulator
MGKELAKTFTIGQLAKAAQVNPQTLRFYERKGILKPTSRLESRYRVYDLASLKRLQFIKQAKSMGFSLDEIQSLLNLRIRSTERCNQVRAKAERKLTDVRDRISQLRKLERTLVELVSDCENRVVSDCCPILEKMETGS